jgi:hypothetical protein
MLRVVSQLMFLNEIDSQNDGLIKSLDDEKVVIQNFVSNLNLESEFPLALQGLT